MVREAYESDCAPWVHLPAAQENILKIVPIKTLKTDALKWFH